MLTPAEIATIRTRCEKTVMRCGYEAAGTGRHNDYRPDVSALLAHIAAQSEQLQQAQAEGAIMREALLTAQGCVKPSPPESYMRGIFSLADLCLQQINSTLSSTPAITAYAERAARMEEALRLLRDLGNTSALCKYLERQGAQTPRFTTDELIQNMVIEAALAEGDG